MDRTIERLPDHLVARDLRGASAAALAEVRQRNLSRLLDLVFDRHPYYARLFRRIGLRREHVATLDDLDRIPVLEKADFIADPEAFRLRLDEGPAEWRTIWDVMYTSGSSGRPAPFFSTTYDYYNILTASRRMLDLRGVHGDDIVANLNPMTIYPTGAYNRALHAVSTLGACVFSPLPGNPSPDFLWGSRLDEVVRLIERRRASVLWGIASYIRTVAHRARALGADFSSVRVAMVSGEATDEAMRADIVAALEEMGARAPFVSISYGQTETQTGLVECRPGSGLHNPLPEAFHWEAVDPISHAPLTDGETGLALLTHLDRRGTVLLRYALGDRIALTRAACPHCGAIGERVVGGPRRADQRVKIRGALVDTHALVETIQAVAPGLTFQAIVDKPADDPLGSDRLIVALAAAGDARLAAAIVAAVKRDCLVTPIVTIDPGVADADEGAKRRLFVDRRSVPAS